MTVVRAFTGARIFDGKTWHDHASLLVAGDTIVKLANSAPPDAELVDLGGGMLVPGFIDLQVNGGGGALLNTSPTLEGIRAICAAHAPFGTTGLLPTLITDTPSVRDRAIEAGLAAAREGVPGFLGLHLEGPHLSVARKGAHDPALIRPMEDDDLDTLIAARGKLPNLLTTVAAEIVTPAQIAALRHAGVVISIGHSDAGFATVTNAADAGATMVTHLFNAQSQLGNREPGVVGAALSDGRLHAGLIADGIHVHPVAISAALRAKTGPGRIFLVTDAMSVTGTDKQSFSLNRREIYRVDGALRLADGTLAGADLTMIGAVRYVHQRLAVSLDETLRMASLYPAEALGVSDRLGGLASGMRASFLHLSEDLEVLGTWICGVKCFSRPRK